MRPMGMTREDYYDDDVNGCTTNGRPSGIYNLKGKGGDTRAYHSLRGGKKDSTRRYAKRRAPGVQDHLAPRGEHEAAPGPVGRVRRGGVTTRLLGEPRGKVVLFVESSKRGP